MAGRSRLARSARVVAVAAALATALLGVVPLGAVAALPAWDGGINLYRSGVFSTQQTWRWCTAADVQIIRNIVLHRDGHSRDAQQRYYRYMRDHNRYPIPASDGVDPGGWAAGLRHFVDARYKRVASDSFSSALRSAVTSLRKTKLPVGITVSHGNHAWVLTGFTATADPAKTRNFSVTSVRVVGPLWGRPEPELWLRHAAEQEAHAQAVQVVLHAVALRRDRHGLGGQVGVDPAGRRVAVGSARVPRGLVFALCMRNAVSPGRSCRGCMGRMPRIGMGSRGCHAVTG